MPNRKKWEKDKFSYFINMTFTYSVMPQTTEKDSPTTDTSLNKTPNKAA